MLDYESLKNSNDFSEQRITMLFKKHGLRRSFGKNEMVFARGEHAGGVYYLHNGKLRGFLSSFDGEEFTVVILHNGILIGEDAFMAPPRRTLDVIALRPSELYYLETADLLTLVSTDSGALTELLGCFMKKILMRSYQMIASLQVSGEKKLAFLIMAIYAREGRRIDYTHEELAGMSGLSRVTVTKLLSALETRGAIELKYKSVIAKDHDALMQALQG